VNVLKKPATSLNWNHILLYKFVYFFGHIYNKAQQHGIQPFSSSHTVEVSGQSTWSRSYTCKLRNRCWGFQSAFCRQTLQSMIQYCRCAGSNVNSSDAWCMLLAVPSEHNRWQYQCYSAISRQVVIRWSIPPSVLTAKVAHWSSCTFYCQLFSCSLCKGLFPTRCKEAWRNQDSMWPVQTHIDWFQTICFLEVLEWLVACQTMECLSLTDFLLPLWCSC